MDLTLSVRGCNEIAALLAKLPEELQYRHGKRGLEAAAEVTVSAVKGRMPVATGLAKASIGRSPVRVYRQSGTLFTAVEPRKGFRRVITLTRRGGTRIRGRKMEEVPKNATGRVQNPRKYMHLIEGGRKAIVPVNRKALHPALSPNAFFRRAGPAAGHPVFQPARDASEGAAKDVILAELERGVADWNSRNAAPAS